MKIFVFYVFCREVDSGGIVACSSEPPCSSWDNSSQRIIPAGMYYKMDPKKRGNIVVFNHKYYKVLIHLSLRSHIHSISLALQVM